MQSKHFTFILIFSPLCLYKNIPIPIKIMEDLLKIKRNPPIALSRINPGLG